MLMSVVLLAKHARWTMPNKATGQLHASLFACGIVDKVLRAGLPHPQTPTGFIPDQYRMREARAGDVGRALPADAGNALQDALGSSVQQRTELRSAFSGRNCTRI